MAEQDTAPEAPQEIRLPFDIPEGHVLVQRAPGHGPVFLPQYSTQVDAGGFWHMRPEEADERPDWVRADAPAAAPSNDTPPVPPVPQDMAAPQAPDAPDEADEPHQEAY